DRRRGRAGGRRGGNGCFFFQAEDGIRGYKVTGVQTCALPILLRFYGASESEVARKLAEAGGDGDGVDVTICARDFEIHVDLFVRSEERRVGKECRSRGAPEP